MIVHPQMRRRVPPGIGAHLLDRHTPSQRLAHSVREAAGVAERGEEPGLSVRDELADGCGVAGDEGAAAGERLAEGPGSDERVGQVHVGVGALQQADVVGVVDLAGEVDARRVEGGAGLGAQQLAPTALRRAGAVADAVATDHDDADVGARPQQVGYCAHHDMETAIGLQVAGDVGDEFVGGIDVQPGDRGDLRPQRRVRAADIEVDALRHQRDGGLRPGGIGFELETRRRLAMAAIGERQQVDRILGADAGVVGGIGRELRVEADIVAGDVVVELVVSQQRSRGPNVAQVQQLAPAVMADDDLRLEPERLELSGDLGNGLGAGDGLLEVARVGVDGGLVARRHLVGDFAHAGNDVLVRLADEDDIVLPRG